MEEVATSIENFINIFMIVEDFEDKLYYVMIFKESLEALT